jgi:hypothetical protein
MCFHKWVHSCLGVRPLLTGTAAKTCSEDKSLKQSVETLANTSDNAWTGKSVQAIHTGVIFVAYVAKGTIMYMCRIQVMFCFVLQVRHAWYSSTSLHVPWR